MKKYYPQLDAGSDVLNEIPHPKCQSIAKAIRVCNKPDEHIVNKLRAVALVLL